MSSGKKKQDKKARPTTPTKAIKARRKRLRQQAEVTLFWKRLVLLVAMLFVLFGVIFGIHAAQDNAMRPGITAGDLVMYFRFNQGYNSRDVVVYKDGNTLRLGRIVAKGGDTVDIRQDDNNADSGELYINGNRELETDISTPTVPVQNKVTYPVTLAADEYFILGDYRIGATDSRAIGPVKQSAIKGRVILVIRSGDGL